MNTLRRMSRGSDKDKGPSSAEANAAARLTFTMAREHGSFGISLTDDNTVTAVTAQSSAATAGLQPGDVVLSLNGKTLGSRKIASLLADISEQEITLIVDRRPEASNQTRRASGSMLPRIPLTGRRASKDASDASDGDELNRTASFALPG